MEVSMERLMILYLAVSLFSGCATILSGTTDQISFNSEPSKANILLEGIQKAKTPVIISVKKKFGNSMILVRKKGYETQTHSLNRSLDVLTLLNLFNGVGFIVDLVTGAAMKADQKVYHFELEKK